MLVSNVIDIDFVNYKEISMFIATPFCSGKCWRELGLDCSICQNEELRKIKPINIHHINLVNRYLDNPLSKAIVIGGMEPLDSVSDIYEFIFTLRQLKYEDPVVIYTGYKEDEEIVQKFIDDIRSQQFKNIILKVGRYIPNRPSRYDELLGVTLASDNQYSIEI